jgi:enoyl-CoA hydratase
MSEVLLEIVGHVAAITLNAPERRNALTPDMVRELLDACDAVDANKNVGAVVLKANGSAFCSGAHRAVLDAASLDPASPEQYETLGLMYQSFVRVGELLPPTVAAVRGQVVGAGLNLMLATDVRIIAESARVISGFQRIGIHPGGGHFQLLGRLAGREAAAAISLFGAEIDGRRAVELGMAWSTLPEAEVDDAAMRLAGAAAADPELARNAARSMRMELGPPALGWQAALEVEHAVQLWSLRRKAVT